MVTDLLAEIGQLRAALTEIAGRRNILKPSRNSYDAGYTLGTELCCDIADQALEGSSPTSTTVGTTRLSTFQRKAKHRK